MLKEAQHNEYPLYTYIGCQHHNTYTSTRLHIIVYKKIVLPEVQR